MSNSMQYIVYTFSCFQWSSSDTATWYAKIKL